MFSRSIFEKDLYNSLYVIKKQNKLAIFSCVMSIIKTPHLLPSIIFNRRLQNAKSRINTAFFFVKIKYLLKVYGKIELRETIDQST